MRSRFSPSSTVMPALASSRCGLTSSNGGAMESASVPTSTTRLEASTIAAECDKKVFWREIRKSSTAFNIDTRRAILHAVEANDEEAMQKWAEHTDFQKFMLKTIRDLKTKTGKEKWQNKPLDKKLLAWADDLKKSLTAFQFSCYQFDEATVKISSIVPMPPGKAINTSLWSIISCFLSLRLSQGISTST